VLVFRPTICIISLVAIGCQSASPSGHHILREPGRGPRVLAVTAHPDDEIAFAATLYKTATFLDGTCDLFVVTNGEGGYKYSTLSEPVYGVPLTDPEVGRAQLPDIRQHELLAAAEVLHLHEVVLLRERDHHYTRDEQEVLGQDAVVWDLARVRDALREQLASGHYDFVLTHLPVPQTHGHHKAATILALEAVAALPRDGRPVVLGVQPGGVAGSQAATAGSQPPFVELAGHPITRVRADVGPYVFDRTESFGHQDKLDYQIVVNWAIAEHKSQGTMQRMMNRWDREEFFIYEVSPPDAPARVGQWFSRLADPQFATRNYGAGDGVH